MDFGRLLVVLGPKRRLEGHRAPKKLPGGVPGSPKGAKGRFCIWLREPEIEYYRGPRAKIEGSRESPFCRMGAPVNGPWLGRAGPGGGVRELPEGGGEVNSPDLGKLTISFF